MRNPIEEGVAEEREQKKVATRKFQISRATENTLCYGIYGSSRKNHNILARRTSLGHFKMGEHLAKCGALHLI